jgi:fumarate reductase subunit C
VLKVIFFLFFFLLFIRYFPHLHFQCYLKSPPYPPPTPLLTHSHFLALAFPVLRHKKFARPMGLSFQWWPTRSSSDTYAARDRSSKMCLFLLICEYVLISLNPIVQLRHNCFNHIIVIMTNTDILQFCLTVIVDFYLYKPGIFVFVYDGSYSFLLPL